MLGLGLGLTRQRGHRGNLKGLLTTLYGNGEEGAFFVPKPQVMGQQVLYQDATGTTPVTSDGDPVGMMLDLSKGMTLGPDLFEGFADIGQWADNGNGSWSISGLGDGEHSDLNGDSSFTVRTGALVLMEYDLIVTTGRVRTYLRHSSPDVMPTGNRARMLRIVRSPLLRIRADSGAVATISNISIREILGNHAAQEVSVERPVYRTDGTRHWLEGDGIDDSLPIPLPTLSSEATLFYVNAAGVNLQPYLSQGVSLDFLTGSDNYYYGIVNRLLTEIEEQSIRQLAAPDQRETVPAMWLDGTSGTYASTPHSEAVDITGSLTAVAQIAPAAWSGFAGSRYTIAAKNANGAVSRSWILSLEPNGNLVLWLNGSSVSASPPPGTSDGAAKWIAVALDLDQGETRFFVSDDGENWTLYDSVSASGVTGLTSNDGILEVGSWNTGTQTFKGTIYCAQIYSGSGFDPPSGPTGTLVADFNAEDAGGYTIGGESFTSSTTGEEWTLNGNAMIGEYPA